MLKVTYKSLQDAWLGQLTNCYVNGTQSDDGHLELINSSFKIEAPEKGQYDKTFDNEIRKFNSEFAERFFQWTWHGGSNPAELYSVNENAKDFTETTGRNTAYGPRIVRQMDRVLAELSAIEGTRRASIMILEGDDSELLEPKRNGESKQEYPCTDSMNYFIRDGKLNVHVKMRSNCLSKTICYDLYNQSSILESMARLLHVGVGSIEWTITNGHILEDNIQYSNNIILEMKNKPFQYNNILLAWNTAINESNKQFERMDNMLSE